MNRKLNASILPGTVCNKVTHKKGRARLGATLCLLILFVGLAFADSIGVYECPDCNPSDPFDENTQAFIANEVNSDHDNWEVGEHVLIVNPDTGESGVWGRASAFGPRQYMGPSGAYGYVRTPGGWGNGYWHWEDPCGFLEVCGWFDPY